VETGITIHFVNENYDEGNVLFQEKVAVTASDTPEDVALKVHELEHRYLPQVIETFLNA
jgi:phosphoribosylglycinamide formyltransferase-1